MSKRLVCSRNIHRVKLEKPILLVDESRCSFEKYEKRNPMTKIARDFGYLSDNIKFNLKHPHYDPHGFTVTDLFVSTTVKFLNTIHPDYKKIALEEILEKVK